MVAAWNGKTYSKPAEIASVVFLVLFKDGVTEWVEDFIFLFPMLIKGMRRRGEFNIFLRDPRNGKILLSSSSSSNKLENVLWSWGEGMSLDSECMEFVIASSRVKFYDFIIIFLTLHKL